MENSIDLFYDPSIVHREHISTSISSSPGVYSKRAIIVLHATAPIPFENTEEYKIVNGFHKYRIALKDINLKNIIDLGRNDLKNISFYLALKKASDAGGVLDIPPFAPVENGFFNKVQTPATDFQKSAPLNWPELSEKRFPSKPKIKRRGPKT